MTSRGWRVAGGLGLLAVALLLPVNVLAATVTTARPEDARLGLTLLRFCLGLNGVLALAWAALPAGWSARSGMPPSAIGLAPSAEPEEPGQFQRRRAALLALLAAATVLRIIGLNRDMWLDEIATLVSYLRLSPWQNLFAYQSSNQHLLYSLLASLSVRLFGESAWAARLPAVLFGMGSLGALYLLGITVTSKWEALLATALMAFSYHHVWFSQNARGYTGMIFWTLLGTWFFLRSLAYSRRPDWAGYVVSLTAGILMLQQTAFVFLGHLTGYILNLPRWPGWRTRHWPLTRAVMTSALFVCLFSLEGYSPMAPAIARFFRTESRVGLGISDPRVFVDVLLTGLNAGFLGLALVLGVFLMGIGWWSYWRRSPLVASLLVLPPIYGTLAMVALKYGAYPRSFLYVLPVAFLVLVRGSLTLGEWVVDRLPPAWPWHRSARAWLGLSLVGLMLTLSAVTLLYNYRYPKQNYTGALAYVEARRAASDQIAVVGQAIVPYKVYYAPSLEFAETVGALAALERPGSVVWVLYSFPRDMRLRWSDVYDYVESNYELVAVFPGTLEDGNLYVARLNGLDH